MKLIQKKNIKKGTRFYWFNFQIGYGGVYEIICFRKNLSEIYCYKPNGARSTIKENGELGIFDERIINNKDFKIIQPKEKQV